jgi:hypothetical protein
MLDHLHWHVRVSLYVSLAFECRAFKAARPPSRGRGRALISIVPLMYSSSSVLAVLFVVSVVAAQLLPGCR